jgi:predicted RNase H-like nuclease
MTILLVGFDSAWTVANSGAIVGVLRSDNKSYRNLGAPQTVNFLEAEEVILDWQGEYLPRATIVTLDQPTIVVNDNGQRPVEKIVCSVVSRRHGGMQPAFKRRSEMFGNDAPIWPFLRRFGGPADPLKPIEGTRVFETYPVLAMIALGWVLPDSRSAGRLPKYNPARRKTFSISDWRYVCQLASDAFDKHALLDIARWISDAGQIASPRKKDQDCLDACLCLLVAFYLAEKKECLMVGDGQSGYIVVPRGAALREELEIRCKQIQLEPSQFVRVLTMSFP